MKSEFSKLRDRWNSPEDTSLEAEVLLKGCSHMLETAMDKSSGINLAVIGAKHFGNPIPQEWYAAARELIYGE